MTPHQRFIYDGGKELLFNGLNKPTTVAVLGGYLGDSAKRWSKIAHEVHVFEPIQEFAESLEQNLGDVSNVKVWPYAVGGNNRQAKIANLNDSSSMFRPASESEFSHEIQVRDVAELFNRLFLGGRVDLMEINIEGGEFEVLERIFEAQLSHRIKVIQVQFHEVFESSTERMEAIQSRLSETHSLVWRYDWVWERWCLKTELDSILVN
jgi:FkbM family methyltransferase